MNRSFSTSFTMKKFLTKSEIREVPNKRLVTAIRATVLRKEPTLAEYIKYLLQKSGVVIPEYENF